LTALQASTLSAVATPFSAHGAPPASLPLFPSPFASAAGAGVALAAPPARAPGQWPRRVGPGFAGAISEPRSEAEAARLKQVVRCATFDATENVRHRPINIMAGLELHKARIFGKGCLACLGSETHEHALIFACVCVCALFVVGRRTC
jgi:hypothetical protein